MSILYFVPILSSLYCDGVVNVDVFAMTLTSLLTNTICPLSAYYQANVREVFNLKMKQNLMFFTGHD